MAATAGQKQRTRASSRLRLRTLVSIRWAAIMGQAGTVLLVHYGLGYRLPLVECALVIATSAFVNVIVTVRGQLGRQITDLHAAAYLAYDILQLAALLYLTGGLNNPFALLLLAPVIVSATVLSRSATIVLGLIDLGAVTILAIFHLPLPWPPPGLSLPDYYVMGIWQALVIGVLFIAAYVGRVTEEVQAMTDALAETQMAQARAKRLSAVGALAAAAAHELGSPLATIAVVAKEMAREVPKDSPLAPDVELLIEQSARCRDILAQLARRPEDSRRLVPCHILPLAAYLDFVAEPYRNESKAVLIESGAAPGDESPEPELDRVPEIVHALGTLVQNAAQFARSTVRIDAEWTASVIRIVIGDDGPGFPPLLLDRLGEPYVSTRKDEEGHMGLGLFIAQTLLGRYGAELGFANRTDGGAQVTVTWDRMRAEALGKEADDAG